MKIKKIISSILAACIFFTLAGCTLSQPDTEISDDIVITDMIGREVTVTPGAYKKVVCIGAGALRMYSYIGDVSLLCGVEDIDNTSLEERPKMFDASARPYIIAYEEAFSALPSCGVGGPNMQTAEPEKILACDPDIVISEYEDTDKENALQQQLGIPVITLRSGPSGVFADEFKSSLTLLGKIFGKEDRAAYLISFIENEIADIGSRTAGIPEDEKPSVYICGLGNWGTTNHLFTSQSYAGFKAANIKNVVTDLGIDGVGAIEEEKFVSIGKDIDIMFIDSAAVKNIKPLYADDNTLFDSCKAWQNGEVYLEMAYNAYYTNYELDLANTWFIAKTVYPDRFDDIDIAEKLSKITDAFLGKALAEDIYACPASFGGYSKIDVTSFFK